MGIAGALLGAGVTASLGWEGAQNFQDVTLVTLNGLTRKRTIVEASPEIGKYETVMVRGIPVKIHCFEAGQANTNQGRIFLLHGFGSNVYQWSPIFDELAEKFHVIAIDCPGSGYFGFMPNDAYDFHDDLPPVLNAFLDQRGFTENVVAVASSLGGPIAEELAVNNPRIAKLVLFDSQEAWNEPNRWSFAQNQMARGTDLTWCPPLARNLERFGAFVTLAGFVHPTLGTLNSYEIEQYAKPYFPTEEDPKRASRMIKARAANAAEASKIIQMNQYERARQLQSKITQPTLVVQSEWDGFIDQRVAEWITEAIPHSQMVLIPHDLVPTAGHTVMNDNPAIAIQLISDFVTDNPSLMPRPEKEMIIFDPALRNSERGSYVIS